MTEGVDHKTDEDKKGNGRDPGKALTMKARFARYNSPFLQLMIPLLTTRYVWLALEDINPFNFLKKPDPSLKPHFTPWQKPTTAGYIRRNFAALGMGTTLLGIIAFYSKRTYDDIRTLYSEAVGYELNKKPEEVNWSDIFLKSRNAALVVTRNAFIKRTVMRVGAGSAFLMPWHIFRDWKNATPKYDANANAGVGAIGTYLSLDGFIRTQTFFEAEQSLVDKSINHSDADNYEIIKSQNVQKLLLLQRKHLNAEYRWPALNSMEGKQEVALADRIAELLNQTYNNTAETGKADFTFGKFNYLVGFGLLDAFPASLGFVELANKSPDMKDVKTAAAAIKGGQAPQDVFKQFGIDLNNPDGKIITPALASEPVTAKFADHVPQAKDRLPQAARTLQDFAAQTDATRLAHP